MTPGLRAVRVAVAVLCAAALLAAATAHARIGDTHAQLVARFGAPVSEGADPLGITDAVLVFERHDVTVTAELLNGVCAKIVYKKLKLFTEAEGLELLRSNSKFEDMGDWAMDKTKKYRVNDAFFIRYEERYNPDKRPPPGGKEEIDWDAKALFNWNKLTITTVAYEEAVRAHAVKRNSGIAEKLKEF